jgi:hypothetical protein
MQEHLGQLMSLVQSQAEQQAVMAAQIQALYESKASDQTEDIQAPYEK